MEFNEKIQAMTEEMIAIRRELHQCPELGTFEVETQKKISALQALSLVLRSPP